MGRCGQDNVPPAWCLQRKLCFTSVSDEMESALTRGDFYVPGLPICCRSKTACPASRATSRRGQKPDLNLRSRLSDDELQRKSIFHSKSQFARHHFMQTVHGALANLSRRLRHGRHARKNLGCFWNIVEPRNGEIAGHIDTKIDRRMHGAYRGGVAGADDCGRTRRFLEHFAAKRRPAPRLCSLPYAICPGLRPCSAKAAHAPFSRWIIGSECLGVDMIAI